MEVAFETKTKTRFQILEEIANEELDYLNQIWGAQ